MMVVGRPCPLSPTSSNAYVFGIDRSYRRSLISSNAYNVGRLCRRSRISSPPLISSVAYIVSPPYRHCYIIVAYVVAADYLVDASVGSLPMSSIVVLLIVLLKVVVGLPSGFRQSLCH
ncbi:hypothetical protein ABEF95_009086 [Exophiala dermatitidis]|uniref:Uncharacterized protein n=1 Tax=Exophiala dermatitidis (strain ATCC 34100 / CBS 525.76 / NIH/UT8656) TaxID=858893 RepID=H6BNA4_EXODN|nr:uncharacterized protein HMPREF1120_01370 [Exophiala dermatitidis NIH/UT8656]EHY53172.1 hypothetical protein HMPREF1120_01370 [Exophiala dermatitidis NIH/UT8656]